MFTGLCKIYDTYVGNYDFQSKDEDCIKLGELGNEFKALLVGNDK